jgi:arsenate reductase
LLGGIDTSRALAYIGAQLAGGCAGTVIANLMFDLPVVEWSTHTRGSFGLWLGEVVATFGLLTVILGVVRSGRTSAAPLAVGAYIGAAYWFTSSTSFANPAVTIARALTDSFAGIRPRSVPGFVIAQCAGAAIAVGLARFLHPAVPEEADRIVVPHEES